MMTVKEVSGLTGVSIRALHHYDAIGLLHPTQTTESGYRLYDKNALERLQMILLFRELQFPLKDIKEIIGSPKFDREKALEQQIKLLSLQKERLEALIDLARGIKTIGVETMNFSAFDKSKINDYAAKAKATWGETAAYKEYENKSKNRAAEQESALGDNLMDIFKEIGAMRGKSAADAEVQALIAKLQAFITDKYYTCTPEILASLGEMYVGGGEMTENIDKAGGEGTAQLAKEAIDIFCAK